VYYDEKPTRDNYGAKWSQNPVSYDEKPTLWGKVEGITQNKG